MKILTKQGGFKQKDIDALIVPVTLNDKPKGLSKVARQFLQDAIDRKEFSGKAKEMKRFVLPGTGKKGLRQVVFLGIGKPQQIQAKVFGELLGQALRELQADKIGTVGFWFRDLLADQFEEVEHLAQIVAEYGALSTYEFTTYRKKKQPQIKSMVVYVENKEEMTSVKDGVSRGSIIGGVVNEMRDIANRPSNELTPKLFAKMTQDLIREEKAIKMKVLGEKEMEKHGMGAVLGVSKGSAQEAQFMILEYWGGEKNDAPYVMVGKGITFDTGGISLKPSSSMDEMKFDMCGGASAIGIIRTAAALKLPINVVALVPTSENMPGQNAYKPGDVLRAMDGSTIEVLNTDAEGRLLLADALVYARAYKPKQVIDLATLTGACVVALSDAAAGMFTKDDAVSEALFKAGKRSGDMVWPLPLVDEYKAKMKSKVADISNISSSPYGGALTAAIFLQHFVDGKYPWVHMDIAGVAWASHGKKYLTPGSTGSGIRVVVEWLMSEAHKN